MPATVDWYVLAAAILAGALIGKEVFGGYGSYPFHPAAVGYAVAAVSWPEQVFRYPAPYANIPLWDASGVATSSTISDTLRSGGLINITRLIAWSLGRLMPPRWGPVQPSWLVACGLFLWMQKDVRLTLPELPHHGGPHRLLLPAPAGSDGGDRLYGGPCVPPALCARRDADGRDALQRRLPAQ